MFTKLYHAAHLMLLRHRMERLRAAYERSGGLRLLARMGRAELDYVRAQNRHHPLY